MTTSDFNYMKEAIAADLAELLTQDLEMSIADSFLKNELATGQLA